MCNTIFQHLHFNVKQRLMMDDIRTTAWDFPISDHSQFDPFVFIILSHSDSNDAISSVDHSLMPIVLAGM